MFNISLTVHLHELLFVCTTEIIQHLFFCILFGNGIWQATVSVGGVSVSLSDSDASGDVRCTRLRANTLDVTRIPQCTVLNLLLILHAFVGVGHFQSFSLQCTIYCIIIFTPSIQIWIFAVNFLPSLSVLCLSSLSWNLLHLEVALGPTR